MSDFGDFFEFVNFAGSVRERPKRYLRDYSDPFNKYSIQQFHSRYRFTPQAVRNTIIPLLEADLRKSSNRGLPFPVEIMVLITLRFYATGSFQKLDGDLMAICQQSVSRIIAVVTTSIAQKMKMFVKFPSSLEDINTVKQNFFEVAFFPGVIKIKSLGGTASEVYRNRKGWFSINVQAVTGPNMEFFDLVARWPGSTHDSFIYNSSSLKQRITTGNLEGLLLGDSGYAVSPVLLTPFLSPNTPAQEKYNKSQIKTRNTIERTFGVWKRKFPCLQLGMGVKLETAAAVITACATLHNISILLDDIKMPTEDEILEENIGNNVVPENENSNGFLVRQSIVNRFFLGHNYIFIIRYLL